MSSRKAIVTAFGLLEATIGRKGGPLRDTEEQLYAAYQSWGLLLEPLSDEDLIRAVAMWTGRPGVFWPNPGDLLALAPSTSVYWTPAETMWGRVLHALRHARGEPGEAFSWHENDAVDAAVMAGIAACGGWAELRRCDDSQLGFSRQPFSNAYTATLERLRGAALTGKISLKQIPASEPSGDLKTLTDKIGAKRR